MDKTKKAIAPALVIMAAGMGSRYGGLKQIDPVGPSGEIVLDYSVYDAMRSGFGRVIFIIRPEIEAEFKSAIGSKYDGHTPVEYAFQSLDDLPAQHELPPGREKPWGTAHAMLAVRDMVEEPFCILNADDFYGRGTFQLIVDTLRGWDPEERLCCLAGFVLKNTLSDNGEVARGICDVDSHGYLKRIVERTRIKKHGDGALYWEDGAWKELSGEVDCSMNMWGFTSPIFPLVLDRFHAFLADRGREMKSEYLIPSVIDELMQSGELRVQVLHSNDKWMGVTYTEDKPVVQAGILDLVNKGVYPRRLWP